ncbi:MAG: hypothetical protein ACXWMC_02535 [Syntrophales bacterium]
MKDIVFDKVGVGIGIHQNAVAAITSKAAYAVVKIALADLVL